MTTVMIVHSTCGSRVYIGTYIHDCMISDNNCFYKSFHIISFKLSITAFLYGSRVYIGMYIPDASLVFTITNNLKQIISYYLILKLSITASLYGSRVYLCICIYDYSDNIPFSHIAIL